MRLNNKRERENVNERSIEKVIISQSKSCKSSAPNIPSPSKMQMGKTVQTFTLKPKPECISHAQVQLKKAFYVRLMKKFANRKL